MIKLEKPRAIVLQLYNLGAIHSLQIKVNQVGDDRSETRLTLTGTWGTSTFKVERLADYLSYGPGYNSIARLVHPWPTRCREWNSYLEQEDKDLTEYKRLQEKFS